MVPNSDAQDHLETAVFLNDKHVDAAPELAPSSASAGKGDRLRPASLLSRSSFATVSTDSLVTLSAVQSVEHGAQPQVAAREPTQTSSRPVSGWRAKRDHFWAEYKGIVLIILAEMFAAMMATTARYLETLNDDGDPMDPFQVLFVRMTVTMTASLVYMYWAKVPHAPFGQKGVRWLLLARGFGGFFGVFGLYYSLIYLPLSDATVITFLAPLLAAWICSLILKTPFTGVHKIAGFISLGGVVLIAQPFKFIASASTQSEDPPSVDAVARRAVGNQNMTTASNGTSDASTKMTASVTPAEHAIAVCAALLGVCGAACAYTTISMIGKRAHPLISVNYFATWCTIVSTTALIFLPSSSFRLPQSWREWVLMAFLGSSGFIMQFLLTSGLAHERKRATALNMVYTQMLFALAMDKIVWDTTPGWMSLVGSLMILGAAIWSTLAKESQKGKGKNREVPDAQRAEEEVGLVEHIQREHSEGASPKQGNKSGSAAELSNFKLVDSDDEDIELQKLDSNDAR